jgi:hypothetical protein
MGVAIYEGYVGLAEVQGKCYFVQMRLRVLHVNVIDHTAFRFQKYL